MASHRSMESSDDDCDVTTRSYYDFMTLRGQGSSRAPEGTDEPVEADIYRPSPRPKFEGPTHIKREAATRHLWGDKESGEVADWIYVSSELVHALVFGLEPHGSFRHSPSHRTVFGADELLYVLDGVMAIANPETGEVLRVPAGEAVFFRRDTWHHAFAHGEGPLRVLELFAPPPSAGASGAYARTRPYLDGSRYSKDDLLGTLHKPDSQSLTLRRLGERDLMWRRDLGVLVGIYVSTEHITAGVIEVDPGQAASIHAHGGDELVYVTEGELTVRAWTGDKTSVFEIGPDDACYIPIGSAHEYRNFGGVTARAIFGVAPGYLP
jgi:quercetin dioxygenase-like cupin family protein